MNNYVEELVMSRKLQYLSEQNVLALGAYDFEGAVDLVVQVFREHYRKQTIMPRSQYLTYPGRSVYDRVISLIGYVGGEQQISGIKVINSSTTNHMVHLPRASGVLLLCDVETQRIYCIMEASHISAVRTAAVTATAIQYLRTTSIETVAMIGCGTLAQAHLQMWAQMFSRFGSELLVYDLDLNRASDLALSGEKLGLKTRVCNSGEEAIRQADLVLPATTAPRPWIRGEWLKPGCLVTCVSLLDLGLDAFRLADRIVVDDLELCKQEKRPLQILDEQGELHASKTVSLGSVVEQGTELKLTAGSRVIFNPMGTVMTDLVLANAIFQRAREQGVGMILEV